MGLGSSALGAPLPQGPPPARPHLARGAARLAWFCASADVPPRQGPAPPPCTGTSAAVSQSRKALGQGEAPRSPAAGDSTRPSRTASPRSAQRSHPSPGHSKRGRYRAAEVGRRPPPLPSAPGPPLGAPNARPAQRPFAGTRCSLSPGGALPGSPRFNAPVSPMDASPFLQRPYVVAGRR